ncbi:MAG: DUF3180 domain-containing protein [Bifidobacteriaceae bacterium]|jgi:hypothetical protein|nr:DUF3180 domain-containing protein [Bifidobacteriaceae bacterium]
MNLTRIWTQLVVAVSAAAVTVIVVDLGTDVLWQRVAVPWTVAGLLAVAAAGILAAAWPVRQYVKGKRRRVDPLRAASVWALAKSCALAGATLAGVYLGFALVAVGELHSPLAWSRLWQDLGAFAAAAALAAAGRVAEGFCRLPPEDSSGEASNANQPDSSPA